MTVAAQTFLDLQDAVLHDDFDPTKYRARAKVLLNEALGRLGRRVYALQRRTTATIMLVAGTGSYALPSDFVRLVSLRDPSRHPGGLTETDPRWVDDQPETSSTPQAYAIDGTSLLLWPTPNSAGTLRLRYWATPATLGADTDIPAVPADYTDLLVTYARARLYRLEDDIGMHDALMAQFDLGTLEAKADLQKPSMNRVRQVPRMYATGNPRPRFVRP